MTLERLQRFFTVPLFPLGPQSFSLLWVLQVLLLLVAVSLAARLLKRLLAGRVLRWFALPEGRREAFATLVSLALAALGYVVVAQGMGLDFGALAVLFGALGVGVGFGLQELTRNLSSGLTLLMEGKLNVGDLIEFGNTTGYIREISIRSTVIRTFQGAEIVVPNSAITNAPVKNLSYQSPDGRVDVEVTVAHGSDPLAVTEVLLEAALAEPSVLADPPPKVLLHGLQVQGLAFELWAWTSAIQASLSLRSSLNYAIEQGLREREIELAGSRQQVQLLPVRRGQGDASATAHPDPLKLALPEHPCFRTMDQRHLRELVGSGARRSVGAGTVLVRQGEEGRCFHMVLHGAVDAIHETEQVSRKLFTFVAGEFFGELPLLLQVPYPTTMVAAEDSTLFVVPSGSFHALLASRSDFADAVALEVARRRDVLRSYEDSLRQRGLLGDFDLNHPLQWFRERLRRVLAGRPPVATIKGEEADTSA
ncbi:mechanosensitive ion channel domain-containing protein [Cyanobium sp. Morenito 9A2]|uniref:mechanosensitive ion channel domain-containing protein n=1 Tax=Cyanobium sp. Morenito 9A2 TaxID=2823718 RepID=UPI0020CF5751|nr:mechanosensitive ion channel domain-containing protein [Cyanobium sp. Morenito 9A2]MCP9850379.1 mechanosensitive ion channel [Cyanobium sp. Morenito 9A2]